MVIRRALRWSLTSIYGDEERIVQGRKLLQGEEIHIIRRIDCLSNSEDLVRNWHTPAQGGIVLDIVNSCNKVSR